MVTEAFFPPRGGWLAGEAEKLGGETLVCLVEGRCPLWLGRCVGGVHAETYDPLGGVNSSGLVCTTYRFFKLSTTMRSRPW